MISSLQRAAVCAVFFGVLAGCEDEPPQKAVVEKKVVPVSVELGQGLEPLIGAWGMIGSIKADGTLPTNVSDYVRGKKACETPFTPPSSASEGGVVLAKPPEAMRFGSVMYYPVGDHFQRSSRFSGGDTRRIDRIERSSAEADAEGWIGFTLHRKAQTFPVRVRAMKIIAKPVVVLETEGALLMRCESG